MKKIRQIFLNELQFCDDNDNDEKETEIVNQIKKIGKH